MRERVDDAGRREPWRERSASAGSKLGVCGGWGVR